MEKEGGGGGGGEQDEEQDEPDTRVGIYVSQDIARVAAASGCLPARRLSSMCEGDSSLPSSETDARLSVTSGRG